MHIGQLEQRVLIRPLKFPLGETPHATIETNRTCNIQCRCCYNLTKNYVKPLVEIKNEIDLLLSKRKLQVMTILGGEPTLHPCLKEIIAYIKSKKILCQLLTNGILFLGDQADDFLDGLISSGVDKIIVHVDSGQNHIHKDIEDARDRIFARLEKKKAPFSLSLTIYNGETGILPGLVKKYSRYKYFDGILAVMARDALPPAIQTADLAETCRSLSHDLNIHPATYIPSHQDEHYVSWIFYFYFINAETGATFDLSPQFDGIFRKLYRFAKGRHFFIVKINQACLFLVFISACLAEMALHPKKLPAIVRFIRNPHLFRAVRFHYIAIQTPPEIHQPGNPIHICYNCPDATIRNGRLTPVCIADLINPLEGQSQSRNFRADLFRIAYNHLGEGI